MLQRILASDLRLRLDIDWSGDLCHEINIAILGVGRYGAARVDGHSLCRNATAALNHPNISFLVELGLTD